MPEQRDSAVTLTHRAIRLRESDPDEARALLGRALALDAGYEPAWWWLADLVTDDAERRFCLDRAYDLKVDPDTRRARAALKRVASRAPDEVADFVEPPRPDPVRARPRRPSRTGRWIGVAAAALAALPVYKAAGIPAITPTAGSARITDESEWYFRSMFGSRTQNDFLAGYTSRVLGAKSAAVAFDDDEFGRATRDGFSAVFSGFGAVAAEVPIAAYYVV
ncbi:hypothetical protein GCM10010492_55590 [Saccharothrix mutabilis subsp. mutabilis]|uniref:Tetratricopeptide repeat protein n=1 Tax=Saccharothrix mutabilis subsp. mutabilis TaxID=66855 RepID=A0ABN0UF68_9PSEU